MVLTRFLALLLVIFMASPAFAYVSVVYPLESIFEDGSVFTAGYISPGQTFDLVFSDNSGYDFEWSSVSISDSSLPKGWELVSTERTDSSLVARLKVPDNAPEGSNTLKLSLFSSDKPGFSESVSAKVVVKRGLIDVAFSKKSDDVSVLVGGKAVYVVRISNGSLASEEVVFSSTLPKTWFSNKVVEVKPNLAEDVELEVYPQSSGVKDFAFKASSEYDGVIVSTFSSELNVRPTVKGVLVSPSSGFPFFNFGLLPFQLLNSFVGLLFP